MSSQLEPLMQLKLKFETDGLKSQIRLLARVMVQRIREYSESQVELWRQVPSWALEADGRSGYSDQYARAYRNKLWAINSSVGLGQRGYTVYVDLFNGALVEVGEGRTCSAKDDRLLFLALHLDELDAQKVIDSLEALISGRYVFSNAMTSTERERLREQYGLAPVAI